MIARSQSIARMLGLALVALCVANSVAFAQSGRRVPKRPPSEPPAAEQPAPAPAPPSTPAPPEAPKVRISVAKYVSDFNLPSNVADFVRDRCITRLQRTPAVSVMSGKDLNRKDAIDLAKAGEETYVLWLQFSVDSADQDRSGMGSINLRNLVVSYVLYQPGTGKVQTQGRVYFDGTSAYGRTRGSYSPLGRRGGNYTPEEAGQKTAEYVLDSLGMGTLPGF